MSRDLKEGPSKVLTFPPFLSVTRLMIVLQGCSPPGFSNVQSPYSQTRKPETRTDSKNTRVSLLRKEQETLFVEVVLFDLCFYLYVGEP